MVPRELYLSGSLAALLLIGHAAFGSDSPATRPGIDFGQGLQTIPYRALIQQTVAGVSATMPLLMQDRPTPLAPLAPDLLAAWKDFSHVESGVSHYPAARQTYLDALEEFRDPTGLLPTSAEVSTPAGRRQLEPMMIDGLLDTKTLLVETQAAAKSGESGPCLWAVTRETAKQVLAVGDTVTLKEKNPTRQAVSGILSALRVVKGGVASDRVVLAIKVKGAQPALERIESLATWSPHDGLRVILVPNARIPGLGEDWYPSSMENSSIGADGAIAVVVKAIRQTNARQIHRFVLVTSAEGTLSLAAGVLDAHTETKQTEVQTGKQRAMVGGGDGQVDVDIGQWNSDGTLRFVVRYRAGNSNTQSEWNYSPREGTAEPANPAGDQLPIKVDFETTRVNIPSTSDPRVVVPTSVPLLVLMDGAHSTAIAQFPLPALDGFAKDQVLNAHAPQQKSSPTAIAGPAGRIAFTAYVSGKTPITFDPDQGKNVLGGHHSQEWVLLETNVRRNMPRLVAESAMEVPSPEYLGKHYLGSVPRMMYLPDGRLLFAGADDAREVIAGGNPASSDSPVNSVWLWDGKAVHPLANQFSPVEVPVGSKRVLGSFDYEYVARLNVLLLKRVAKDCVFIIPLAQRN